MDILFKKPAMPENPVKKHVFNLPADFLNKTWGSVNNNFFFWHIDVNFLSENLILGDF